MKLSLVITDLTPTEYMDLVIGRVSLASYLGSTSISGPNVTGVTSSVAMPDEDGPVNATAPAFDSAGLPWDARIHSSNKGTKADGTWRGRRGVDDATVTAVTNELRQRGSQQSGMYMPQPGPAPQGYAPQVQQPPAGEPNYGQPPQGYAPQPGPAPQYSQPPQGYAPQGQQPAPYVQPQGYAPQPGPAPQTYQQPPAPAAMDFGAFMQHISGRMNVPHPQGGMMIDPGYLAHVAQALSARVGRPINSVTDMAADPALVPIAIEIITTDGRWQ